MEKKTIKIPNVQKRTLSQKEVLHVQMGSSEENNSDNLPADLCHPLANQVWASCSIQNNV